MPSQKNMFLHREELTNKDEGLLVQSIRKYVLSHVHLILKEWGSLPFFMLMAIHFDESGYS